MPVKFSPSVTKIDRATKKVVVEHNYIKQMSKESLFEYINKTTGVNRKRRAKCIRELERRGIKRVWN